MRKQQTEFYQKRYEWHDWEFGPSYYNLQGKRILDLHLDERFSYDKFVDYGIASFMGFIPQGIKKLEGDYSNFSSFEDYAELLKHQDEPDGINPDIFHGGRWMQDCELGRQMLDGINPTLITKCTTLPVHFPVTNEMVKDSLNRGLTLEEEMKVWNCTGNSLHGISLHTRYTTTEMYVWILVQIFKPNFVAEKCSMQNTDCMDMHALALQA